MACRPHIHPPAPSLPQRPPCSDPSPAGHAAGKGRPWSGAPPASVQKTEPLGLSSLMGLQQVDLSSPGRASPSARAGSWCHRRANHSPPASDSPQTFTLSTPLRHSATGTGPRGGPCPPKVTEPATRSGPPTAGLPRRASPSRPECCGTGHTRPAGHSASPPPPSA